ncbi:MAG: BatD family protein, partial [Proteobacteria bacterium]|nr:BatD family protein [Pseudomonadota bacterium]
MLMKHLLMSVHGQIAAAVTALVLSVCVMPQNLWAKVSASFDKRKIGVGEVVTLSMTASGQIGSIEMPYVEHLSFVRSGDRNRFVSKTVNGRSQSSNTHTVTFEVEAQKSGLYKIPPIQLKVDGQPYSVSGLTLHVKKQRNQTPKELAEERPDFFIERELSSQVAYVTEPIFETLKLYLKRSWQELKRFGQDPALLKIYHVDQTRRSKTEKFGIPYHLVEISRVLIPLKSAQMDIGQFGIEVGYQDHSQGSAHFFGNFFSTLKTVRVNAPERFIGVNPLPDGAPSSFTGFVGQVKLEHSLSQTMVKSGDSVQLNLIFSGDGWVSSLKIPPLNLSQNFRVYDDKPVVNQQVLPGDISGKKTFTFVLVPLQSGTFDLGSFEWSYFQPESASYKTLSIDLGSVTVSPQPGGGTTTSGSAGGGASPLPQLSSVPGQNNPGLSSFVLGNKDIRDLKRSWHSKGLWSGSVSTKLRLWLVILMVVSGVLLVVCLSCYVMSNTNMTGRGTFSGFKKEV